MSEILRKDIVFFGKPCVLACDGNCQKAWGNNNRPRIYLDDPTQTVYGEGFTYYHYPQDDNDYDLDDWTALADDELGIAPDDTGIYEGGHAKPAMPDERLNKWCARECERSTIVAPGETIDLPDYSKRLYNKRSSEPK